MSDTKHDDILFSVLKECQSLPVFLDHIFGFLQRRTDFYCIAPEPNSPIGLPKGLAENLVRNTYYKWIPKSTNNEDVAVVLQEHEIPQAVFEEVVRAENVNEKEDITEEIVDEVDNINVEHSYNRTKKPEPVTNRHFDFTKSDSYNGAVYDNYCWSQTINEIEITIKLPENVKAKDLKVTILAHKISVRHKGGILLEGDLCHKCKHNEAIWSLDGNTLQIPLDKCKELWWDCLFTFEQKLDLTKIDCSRPYEDLTEDAQAKIEELNWNQERKRLGLPTSNDLLQQATLRKAWNAKGSPFSGEFDPSSVSFY
ncbi:unnamed protein product [Ceutorhynchus assimilis]|uniref:Nuclear migration protein nudC n=1 Tax=Ceutorhynchus assimilis TaxID=467358 RepID=A0A9N9N0Q6_9CUCU|nr:unnamed protein product [Ceutorhynchus assimilis]CAG9771636.1 unnamed protein product [Ceutorhynchus assimilis]